MTSKSEMTCTAFLGFDVYQWKVPYVSDSVSAWILYEYKLWGRVGGVLPSAGKNTSPCAGGERGVPGSDNRWRPVSDDCLVMIWETVRVFVSGDPPRNTGFSWPRASLNTHTHTWRRSMITSEKLSIWPSKLFQNFPRDMQEFHVCHFGFNKGFSVMTI